MGFLEVQRFVTIVAESPIYTRCTRELPLWCPKSVPNPVKSLREVSHRTSAYCSCKNGEHTVPIFRLEAAFVPLQVAEASGFSQAVQQWRGILDPELQSLPTPKVCVEPPYDKPTDQQAAAQAASQVEEDDEDLRGDLQRIRGQKSGAKSRSVHGDKGHSLVEKTGLDQLSLDDQSTQHQQKPKRGEVPGAFLAFWVLSHSQASNKLVSAEG